MTIENKIEVAAEAAFLAAWPKDLWSRYKEGDVVKVLYRKIAYAALAAAMAERVDQVDCPVPDGWKLVPVDPTETMIKRGEIASWLGLTPSISRIWEQMLSVSPCFRK